MISIIIPVYQAEKTIGMVLKALLSQDIKKDYEVICVDDESKDNSCNIIKKYPVKLIKLKKNQGPAVARNQGAKKAKGKLICFLDADCVPEPNWLRKITEGMKSTKVNKIGIIYGSISFHSNFLGDVDNFSHFWAQHPKLPPGIRNGFTSSNICVNKKVFEEAGGFDPTLRLGEDFDLSYRLMLKGYSNFFLPEANIHHFHDRTTLNPIIKRAFKMGKNGGMNRVKYRDYFSRLFPRNPYVLLLLSVPFAFLTTCKIIFKCFKYKKNVFLCAPFIFLAKMSWIFGAFEGIKKYQNTKK